MEDMFVKPGNQERGWNDPPQFSYGLQASHSNKKNLNKRAPVPQYTTGPGALPPGASPPPSLAPPTLPLSGLTPPPRTTTLPPPPGMATPPQRQPMIRQEVPDSSGSQQEGEPDVESVVSALGEALDTCRQSVKKQVCDDVEKRLRLLEESWRAGRLSLAVRRRMDALTQEMRLGHWESADEIHRALMVDHVAEVSQWMVGVKRLIAETRNLDVPDVPDPPESSGELQSAVEEEPLDENAGPGVPQPLEGSAELPRDGEEPSEENVDQKQGDQDAVERSPSADRT